MDLIRRGHVLPTTGGSGGGTNAVISQIIQVALGLFVSTSDLQHLGRSDPATSFDCTFNGPCRWQTIGGSTDRWLLATGQPDPFLWLAATGTVQLPSDPFALIELRGSRSDALISDAIECQQGHATLSMTYWIIGSVRLDLCLTDSLGQNFNCSGSLQTTTMPGKIRMTLPEIPHPFHISLLSSGNGALAIDDIKYDAIPCELNRRRTLPPPRTVDILPWTTSSSAAGSSLSTTITTQSATSTTADLPSVITTTTEAETTTTTTMTTTTTTTRQQPTSSAVTWMPLSTTTKTTTTSDPPFETLIHGNLTRPLFDQRKQRFVASTQQLLCDFTDEFACQWGADSGKWGIVKQGAIPSLDATILNAKDQPAYPAAIVIQGHAMFTSDPIKCQKGPGKLLFRQWSLTPILMQVCAMGQRRDSTFIQCADSSPNLASPNDTLHVFDFHHIIREPFTLSILPQWDRTSRNQFVLIDEIAYIADICTEGDFPPIKKKLTRLPIIFTTNSRFRNVTATLPSRFKTTTTSTRHLPLPRTTTPSSREEYFTDPPYSSFTVEYTSTRRPTVQLPTNAKKPINYCRLLNCDFEEDACNYLNNGLTKVPWTIRNRGYGFPLTRFTDIRPTRTNGQFVSTLLGPGDYAILESPSLNQTTGINVLLFQYYRPSYSTTLRVCLATKYHRPLSQPISFTDCTPLLRSITSRNAYKWNTIHLQIPVGVTQIFLVAENMERAAAKSALALDNIRVAICDPHAIDEISFDELNDDTVAGGNVEFVRVAL